MSHKIEFIVPFDRIQRAIPYIQGAIGHCDFVINNHGNDPALREWAQSQADNLTHALTLLQGGEAPAPQMAISKDNLHAATLLIIGYDPEFDDPEAQALAILRVLNPQLAISE